MEAAEEEHEVSFRYGPARPRGPRVRNPGRHRGRRAGPAAGDGRDSLEDRQGSPEDVVISAKGAPLADINQHVFAILLPTPPPTEFTVTPVSGGVELTDRATGGVVYAPGTEPLTQLAVAPAGHTTANSVWILRDADGNTLHSVPASGMYTLELAGTDQFIGRASVEDHSLLPKKVVLLPAGFGSYMLAMERIS